MLAINEEEELDEAELPGFDAAAHTLYCGNTVHNHLVQVGNALWASPRVRGRHVQIQRYNVI